MSLPLSFLAGLAVLLLHDQLDNRLPGSESLPQLALQLTLMVVPWLAARAVARRVGRVVMLGAVPGRLLLLALRLPSVLVAVVFALIVMGGQLSGAAESLAPELYLGQVLVLLGPLLIMDVSVRLAERRTSRWLEIACLAPPMHLGLDRLRMTFFLVIPILLFALSTDLLAQRREAQVFVAGTALGSSLGLLAMVALLCFLLPLLFRTLMPVSAQLPPHLAEELRRTAGTLGFPRRALLSMHTRHRVVNAALVGPLPWPRYLVLTDGLMSLLDLGALRGVVAHEVGHARANHPAWLVAIFAGLPLLLFYPLSELGLQDAEAGTSAVVLGGIALVAWFVLRKIAHRFELEADQLSAEALGGAEPCVRALRRVGELAPTRRHWRASFRHPSEERRIQHLFACEGDAVYRQRFWRRGRMVRRAVVAALLVALGLFAWTQARLWRTDRAIYLFYTGRVSEARTQLDALPADLPASQRELADELGGEVDATLELGFRDGDWNAMRDDLAAQALQRGKQVLREHGPAAALPWFSLAIYGHRPASWVRCMYRYCRAVADDDQAEADRIRRHLEKMDGTAGLLSGG